MKTLDQTSELDLLRKKLRIMELEVEVYREMGGLAVKGASRSALLSRLMEFALKAVDAEGGALYSLDMDGALILEAVKGKNGIRNKALAELSAKSGKARGNSETNMLAVPLLREKNGISGVITASRARRRGPFNDADHKVLTSLANHLNIKHGQVTHIRSGTPVPGHSGPALFGGAR